jgi:HEAT repeat protein
MLWFTSIGWKRVVGIALAVAALGSTGCANFRDDMSAHHPDGGNILHDWGHRFSLVMFPRRPQEVLEKSRDGDARRRAYQNLWEPAETWGGTPEEQDIMIKGLVQGIRTERDGICRAAAIEKFAEFKDPRAKAFFIQCFKEKQEVAFLDRDPLVRMAALRAAAKLQDPVGVEMLAEAARFDPNPDVRMTALRGLGAYPNQQSVTILLEELKKDEQKEVASQNVALRHTIGESLTRITGKELPARSDSWEQHLAGAARLTPAPSNNPFLRLTSWFE